jgi:predicted nucleotidyltransferase
MTIPPEKIRWICSELEALAAREGITILWACESGSRAWGFESVDSDFDVRFIYLRRREDYLRVSPMRDVIEVPISGELDISGWDIRKALGLLRKSNPPLLEWMQSPLVYSEQPGFRAGFWNLCERYFCPRACLRHYLSMAERNRRSYLEADTIRLKRYFYMLRPLLAARWLKKYGTIPPMEFRVLLDESLPQGTIRDLVDALLERKRAGVELGDGPPISELSDFIERELESFGELEKTAEPAKPWEPLDAYFRSLFLPG